MADHILVRSARDDDKVALWEPDDTHPEGEAFIAGKRPTLVAPTPGVMLAIRNGQVELATADHVKEERQKRVDALKRVARPFLVNGAAAFGIEPQGKSNEQLAEAIADEEFPTSLTKAAASKSEAAKPPEELAESVAPPASVKTDKAGNAT